MSTFIKHSGAILDYAVNWNDGYLEAGEAINSSAWQASSDDIILSNNSFTSEMSSVTAQGGLKGSEYQLFNTVTTSSGRTDIRTVNIYVPAREIELLDRLKASLSVDNSDNDYELLGFLKSGINFVETGANRNLLRRATVKKLNCDFDLQQYFDPFENMVISYVNKSGDLTALTENIDYYLSPESGFVQFQRRPAVRRGLDVVHLSFNSGYSDSWSGVPALLVQLVISIAASLFNDDCLSDDLVKSIIGKFKIYVL